MATMKDVHAGLDIFLKYEPEGELCAEHDEVFACGTPPDVMTEEERTKLSELGWRWDASLPSWARFV